jgi:hypothetical protein
MEEPGPLLNDDSIKFIDDHGTLKATVEYTKHLGFQFKCFVNQGEYDYDTIEKLLKANGFTDISKGSGPTLRLFLFSHHIKRIKLRAGNSTTTCIPHRCLSSDQRNSARLDLFRSTLHAACATDRLRRRPLRNPAAHPTSRLCR